MDQQKKQKQIAKLLEYILARRPDEFGLIPNDQGFVKMKDLIKAINEDLSQSHINQSQIDEILITLNNSPVEVVDNKIRAINRETLIKPEIPDDIPKIIYTCIRPKAYPFVIEKGIHPSNTDMVVMSSNIDMAKRIGQRKNNNSVLLKVHVRQAENEGILFSKFGETLFLAKQIPPGCFSGPPLPKLTPDQKKSRQNAKENKRASNEDHLDEPPSPSALKNLKNSRRDKTSWKNNKKRIRKHKQEEWPV